MLGKSLNNKFRVACHDTLTPRMYAKLTPVYYALSTELYSALFQALHPALLTALAQLEQDLKNVR